MVDEERYCIDILTQLAAVNTALEAVGLKVLEERVALGRGEYDALIPRIPGEATMSRHRRRFDDAYRADVLEECVRHVIAEHLQDEELRCEARTINMDGTPLLTHYTCPVIDKKSKRVVNEDRVTCWDGGYVPVDAGPDKSGHGWNLISITTTTRTEFWHPTGRARSMPPLPNPDSEGNRVSEPHTCGTRLDSWRWVLSS